MANRNPSRRRSPFTIGRRTLLGGGAALLATQTLARGRTAPGKGPNFLFIMADDLGYADLSCYGRRDFDTPHIDRLARSGLRYLDGYANSPVCSATRIGLITGRYQYRFPAGLEEPIAFRNVGLNGNEVTLPGELRSVGYSTALIGKWHIGALPQYSPLKSGYQDFWGVRGGGVDYFTHKVGDQHDLWDGDVPSHETGYLTDLIGNHAIDALVRLGRSNAPFLLSVHFTAPHWPWEGPGDEAVARELDGDKGFGRIQHYDGGTMKTYAEMVQRLDLQVGRLLDALDRLGLEENTVVVFTSDNGGERFSDVWPFTGRKTELLEGGIRVPTIVRWPGRTRAGSTSTEAIMSMDWMPTFLAAAGVQLDSRVSLDGWDIGATLSGGTLSERSLFWRYKYRGQEAARIGNWKYLKIGDNSFLFDIARDPMERANLKARRPEVFDELKSAFDRWNASMLPYEDENYSHGFQPSQMADHFAAEETGSR
jgi:arylsulfatase A-like enzyme